MTHEQAKQKLHELLDGLHEHCKAQNWPLFAVAGIELTPEEKAQAGHDVNAVAIFGGRPFDQMADLIAQTIEDLPLPFQLLLAIEMMESLKTKTEDNE